MQEPRIVVAGLGTIGQGFLALLDQQRPQLEALGVAPRVVGVLDSGGAAWAPQGLDLKAVRAVKALGASVRTLTGAGREWTGSQLMDEARADYLIEATHTDLRTGEPGLSLVREALQCGMHVVLANKGPLVTAFAELKRLGEFGSGSDRPRIRISGATCGALPTSSVGLRDFRGGTILSLEAVLNSTTQIILSRMREGLTYADALAEAKRVGVAETDPSLDVEGWDTANKLVILANAVLGQPTTLRDVPTEGITRINPALLEAAESQGGRVLLLARAEKVGSQYILSVRPTIVDGRHPLSRLGTDEMGILYRTDIFGRTLITNAEQGALGASAAMLKDLIGLVFED